MTSGPLSGLAEPDPAFVALKDFLGMRQARKAIKLVHVMATRAFDWLWERKLSAEERDLIARLSARERADIGLAPRGDDREMLGGFWRS